MYQVAHALPRLPTAGVDKTNLKDEISFIVVVRRRKQDNMK